MNLTQKQELLVARYLNAVGAELGDVSDAVRDRVLARLKARILGALQGSGDSTLRDEQVADVLAGLGSPARAAVELLHRKGGAGGLVLSTDDRVWLGVCGGLAEYLGTETRAVRLVAVLAGVTGPLALLAYLGVYAEMYFASEGLNVPRVDKARLAKYALGTLAAAVAFHAATRIVVAMATALYLRLAQQDLLPVLGQWNWLEREASFMLFLVLALLLPIAALSGLPLAGQWDRTGKRVVQAGLALYALMLSFGIASFLVGLILDAVQNVLA